MKQDEDKPSTSQKWVMSWGLVATFLFVDITTYLYPCLYGLVARAATLATTLGRGILC